MDRHGKTRREMFLLFRRRIVIPIFDDFFRYVKTLQKVSYCKQGSNVAIEYVECHEAIYALECAIRK